MKHPSGSVQKCRLAMAQNCDEQYIPKQYPTTQQYSLHGKLGLSQVGSQSGGVLGDLNLSRFVFFCPVYVSNGFCLALFGL